MGETGTGRRSPLAAALAVALTAAPGGGPAAAAGWVPGDLPVTNGSGAPIACEAAIAHWFSHDFGSVADGETLTLPLVRGADGTVALPGPDGTPMAVEALWCGRPGAVYATRAAIDLPRRAPGDGGWPASVVCRDTGRLVCEGFSVSSPPSPE